MFELRDLDIVTEEGEEFAVSFIPSEKNNNVNGTIHGGVLFTLCDEAIGRFATAKGLIGAAADANVHFYRPAFAGEKLTATVSERKVGKRLGTYLVELKNEKGNLVADALFTVAFATHE